MLRTARNPKGHRRVSKAIEMARYSRNVIKRALALKDFDVFAAHQKMIPKPRGTRPPDMPGQPRQGGVLLILYPSKADTFLILTRRRDDLNDHAGQISFPGGRRHANETLLQAALREAHEEVGLRISPDSVLGELTTIYIPPTDYEVHAFVAWYPTEPELIAQYSEVAEILEVPLSHLLASSTRKEEQWEISGFDVKVPFYVVDDHKIWGATAIMMSEFLERVRIVS